MSIVMSKAASILVFIAWFLLTILVRVVVGKVLAAMWNKVRSSKPVVIVEA
jgi:hypothetical protein